MVYKNHITWGSGKDKVNMNFKTRESMIKYLEKNRPKLNKQKLVYVNFGPVKLPLNQTVWSE